jgi:hypothetical protein
MTAQEILDELLSESKKVRVEHNRTYCPRSGASLARCRACELSELLHRADWERDRAKLGVGA